MIIVVHEAGHLLMAKAFGVRVLTFSVGFGKKLWGIKRGETEYRLSAVPLGGYVRLGGESPEDVDPADPREFLNKPRWQRVLVYLAGPAANIILAIAVFAIVFMVGIEVMNLPDMPALIGNVEASSSAAQAGLRRGDMILTVKGEAVDNWQDVLLALMGSPDKPVPLTVQRGERTMRRHGDAEADPPLRGGGPRRPAAQRPSAGHRDHRRPARRGRRLPPRRRDPQRRRPAGPRQPGVHRRHLAARPASRSRSRWRATAAR